MFALRDGDLAAEVRRVVEEQVTGACAQLLGTSDAGRDDAVHAARKRCKRLRATLRLVRFRLGAACYRHENVVVRDVGRALAHARDAQVLIDTFDAVVAATGGADAQVLAPVRAALEADHARHRRAVVDDPVVLGRVVTALEGVRSRSSAWPLDGMAIADLQLGLQRSYRDGRLRMRQAWAVPTADHFHDWRKRVKDLWHHSELLAPAWPPVLDAVAGEAHVLSGLLGDDHDRAVLVERLCARDLRSAPAALRDVVGVAEAQQAELRAAARPLGARLYAELPERFGARIAAYWRAAS